MVFVTKPGGVDKAPDDVQTGEVKEIVNPYVGVPGVNKVHHEVAHLHRLRLDVTLQRVPSKSQLPQRLDSKLSLLPP